MTGRAAQDEVTVPIRRASVGDLVTDWRFVPSAPSLLTRLRRWRLDRPVPPPRSAMIRPPFPAERWNCLFLFAPTASLDGDQRQILARVAALDGRLLVVIATPSPDRMPDGLAAADALIWKDLPGFDFSAYALALDAVARHAPGATAYVQNDSVLGPFGDLNALIARAPWDLTGFIAAAAVENHLSSFAFVLNDVTPPRIDALAPALSAERSYADFAQVVMLQETRLARVAARGMTVGAFWLLPVRPAEPSLASRLLGRTGPTAIDMRGDATLSFPIALLDEGFPFLKRSLFTKFAGLADAGALRARLTALGWDQPSLSSARSLPVDPQNASGS